MGRYGPFIKVIIASQAHNDEVAIIKYLQLKQRKIPSVEAKVMELTESLFIT